MCGTLLTFKIHAPQVAKASATVKALLSPWGGGGYLISGLKYRGLIREGDLILGLGEGMGSWRGGLIELLLHMTEN